MTTYSSGSSTNTYDIVECEMGDHTLVGTSQLGGTTNLVRWLLDMDLSDTVDLDAAFTQMGTNSYEWLTPMTEIAESSEHHEILWSGAYHMNGNQSITLSSPISAQDHGIVLVFSPYENNAVVNTNWNTFFVPKLFPTVLSNNYLTFQMSKAIFESMATKSLTINDTTISGFASNTSAATSASGITYNNSKWILRYVIGV